MAQRLSISAALLSAWESGRAIPPAERLGDLARLYSKDPASLLDELRQLRRLSNVKEAERQDDALTLLRDIRWLLRDVRDLLSDLRGEPRVNGVVGPIQNGPPQ